MRCCSHTCRLCITLAWYPQATFLLFVHYSMSFFRNLVIASICRFMARVWWCFLHPSIYTGLPVYNLLVDSFFFAFWTLTSCLWFGKYEIHFFAHQARNCIPIVVLLLIPKKSVSYIQEMYLVGLLSPLFSRAQKYNQPFVSFHSIGHWIIQHF